MNKSHFYRFLEIVPGALVWTTFIAAAVLSLVRPIWAIYFIIVFSLYWVFRVFYSIFFTLIAARIYHREIKVDWQKKLTDGVSNWQDYYHVVILPTAIEPIGVLRTTLDGLLATGYPREKIIIAISWEERKKEIYDEVAPALRQEYGDKFFRLIATLHPDGMEGEIKGKGANSNWAGHRVKEVIDELGIPYEKVIVSCFDCDTIVHPKYPWYLTYHYAMSPDPVHTAFQPAVLYSNNIWETAAPMRVAAFSTVFWLLAEQMRPDKMYTFSPHSLSFQALIDVDFWQKDVISDDSHIFLQCLLHYDGNYRVQPLFVPVSMDTVIQQKSFWDGLVSLYKQQRRWGWGVENFPYLVWNFGLKRKMIPWWKRFKYTWFTAEGMYSWATAPILLFILGRLPLYLAHGSVKASVIAQNAPFVLEWLMNVGMIGIIVSAILSLKLIPPRPRTAPRYKYLIMILQWVLLPVTLIIFGSIPATDAQTRLMLGGKFRLGFYVTPKKRD